MSLRSTVLVIWAIGQSVAVRSTLPHVLATGAPLGSPARACWVRATMAALGANAPFYEGRDSGSAITNPDFQQYAESFGVRAWQVKDADGLREAITEAIAFDGPALIEVVIDFDSEPSPFFRRPDRP